MPKLIYPESKISSPLRLPLDLQLKINCNGLKKTIDTDYLEIYEQNRARNK